MKKSDEFIPAFSALNDEIVLAIKNRNFARVILLDKAAAGIDQRPCDYS